MEEEETTAKKRPPQLQHVTTHYNSKKKPRTPPPPPPSAALVQNPCSTSPDDGMLSEIWSLYFDNGDNDESSHVLAKLLSSSSSSSEILPPETTMPLYADADDEDDDDDSSNVLAELLESTMAASDCFFSSSLCSTSSSPPPVKVRFVSQYPNYYSESRNTPTTSSSRVSSYVTINGNEESCGSSFSDFDSTVMVSFDHGACPNDVSVELCRVGCSVGAWVLIEFEKMAHRLSRTCGESAVICSEHWDEFDDALDRFIAGNYYI